MSAEATATIILILCTLCGILAAGYLVLRMNYLAVLEDNKRLKAQLDLRTLCMCDEDRDETL